jgi:hypothetical protein
MTPDEQHSIGEALADAAAALNEASKQLSEIAIRLRVDADMRPEVDSDKA